jgi:hypothetical protein
MQGRSQRQDKQHAVVAGPRAVSGGAGEPVTLVKGAHRWTFWCDSGGETTLLRRLSELATQPDMPFDWFDAALVSHQLSRRLRSDLNRVTETTEK